jgi:hypothetical protein
MSEPTMEALARRVERLERDNGRWRRGAALAVLLLVSAGLLGQAPIVTGAAKALDAERFNLRDRAGHLRGSLGVTTDGTASLVLYNTAGAHQAGLGVLPDGTASIFLGSPAGRTVTELTLYRDGTPSLVVRDRAGKTRMLLGTASDGQPFLYFLDAAGASTWKVP